MVTFFDFLPSFHKNNKVLKQQIEFVSGSAFFKMLTILFVSSTLTYICYNELEDSRIIIWLITYLIFSSAALIKVPGLEATSKQLAYLELTKTVILSAIYCYLPITFINNDSSATLILSIVFAFGGLSCGVLSTLGPCWPILGAFAAPRMLAVSLMMITLENHAYHSLIGGCLLFLICILIFGKGIERTVIESIELRFKNDDLIKELQFALQQKDEANKTKSMFLASASHDLRQPLHALGLLGESLGSMNLDKKQSEVQQHMMSAINSTRSMLGSLLDISKLDAQAITPSPKNFFMHTVFNKLESELATTANEANLIYRTHESICAAYADPVIVELMVRNLISNAIRYTQRGGLLVSCRHRQPDKLMIEVWDTGIGISPEETSVIFKPFLQLANPERDSAKGFGLGLAITQGLAKTIGTQVTLKSVLGQGSVFRFELPVSQSKVVNDIPEDNYPINFSGKTVLIIDDNERILQSMQLLFSNWNCPCILAESEEQALKKIRDHDIDIMLVDYRLRKDKTGRQAIDKIRQSKQRNIPAIIITGDTAVERIKEAQSVDAILMHKPVSVKQLVNMIGLLLK